MTEDVESLLKKGRELRLKGFHAQARDIFQKALSLAEEVYGSCAIETVKPLHALGFVLLLDTGEGPQPEEALKYLFRSLEITKKEFGNDHPSLISILGRIGLTLRVMNRSTEALEYVKRAIELSDSTVGVRGYTCSLLQDLAELLLDQNKPSEAVPYAERALHLLEANHKQPISAGVGYANVVLGRSLLGSEKYEEAVVSFERSLALLAETNRMIPQILIWIEKAKNKVPDASWEKSL